MPEPEIVNPIDADDVADWAAVSAAALLQPISGDRFDRRVQRLSRAWQPERVWGARDDGRWVANLATDARTLTVPAGWTGTRDVAADAVTAVGVAATHRRRGLLRGMITDSLAAAHERGDVLSMLWAAEWPIYGRYGYAPASLTCNYALHPRRVHPLLVPPRGSLASPPAEQLADVAPAIYDRARRRHAGEVDRPGAWWPRALGLDGYAAPHDNAIVVVRTGADGPDGLLSWRVTHEFGLRDNMGSAEVLDLVAASADAYRDLWAYLCGIDAVETIELADRPVDEPIRWQLHDARALRTVSAGDALWLRLLDVPAALTTRGYAGRDHLVLQVVDDATGGYGAGTVALDADGPQARCRQVDAPPDLRLDQRALAACYLGGHRLRAVSAGLPVHEVTPGAIDRFDALFATSWAPWTQTGF